MCRRWVRRPALYRVVGMRPAATGQRNGVGRDAGAYLCSPWVHPWEMFRLATPSGHDGLPEKKNEEIYMSIYANGEGAQTPIHV